MDELSNLVLFFYYYYYFMGLHCSNLFKTTTTTTTTIWSIVDSSTLWIHYHVHRKAIFLWVALLNNDKHAKGTSGSPFQPRQDSSNRQSLLGGFLLLAETLSELHCDLKPFPHHSSFPLFFHRFQTYTGD